MNLSCLVFLCMNDAETGRTTGLVHQSLGCCPELMARLRGFNANLIRRCPGAFGYEDATFERIESIIEEQKRQKVRRAD